jgi:hypothetical protein
MANLESRLQRMEVQGDSHSAGQLEMIERSKKIPQALRNGDTAPQSVDGPQLVANVDEIRAAMKLRSALGG